MSIERAYSQSDLVARVVALEARATFSSGGGVPGELPGREGDAYLNVNDGTFYAHDGEDWVLVGSLIEDP